jgi:hypothetical protein
MDPNLGDLSITRTKLGYHFSLGKLPIIYNALIVKSRDTVDKQRANFNEGSSYSAGKLALGKKCFSSLYALGG